MGIGSQGNFLISATSASKDGIVASVGYPHNIIYSITTNIFIIIDGQSISDIIYTLSFEYYNTFIV